MDFAPTEDSLVVFYDASDPAPSINVEQDADKPELYHVLADGQPIAEVHSTGQLTAEDVAVVAQNA
jgi:hypothetical protein